jgi:hypothetical protein
MLYTGFQQHNNLFTQKENKMYQVTAIYQNSEIGYGEGEGLEYAIEDCFEYVSPMFENEIVTLSILKDDTLHRVDGRVYIKIDGTRSIDI